MAISTVKVTAHHDRHQFLDDINCEVKSSTGSSFYPRTQWKTSQRLVFSNSLQGWQTNHLGKLLTIIPKSGFSGGNVGWSSNSVLFGIANSCTQCHNGFTLGGIPLLNHFLGGNSLSQRVFGRDEICHSNLSSPFLYHQSLGYKVELFGWRCHRCFWKYQGIVGCTLIPTHPLWEIPIYKPCMSLYLWESLQNTINTMAIYAYTVRGTPNDPLKIKS